MARTAAAVALAVILAGACGEDGPEPSSPTVGDEDEPTGDGTPAHADPDLDPESVCGRAWACCRSFVAELPHGNAAATCAGPVEASEAEDGEARCERMREGWRQALTLMRPDEVAEACAAP